MFCNFVRHIYYRLGKAATAMRAQMSEIFGHDKLHNKKILSCRRRSRSQATKIAGRRPLAEKENPVHWGHVCGGVSIDTLEIEPQIPTISQSVGPENIHTPTGEVIGNS